MTRLEELINRKTTLLARLETVKAELETVENEITDVITPVLTQIREIQGKETGVVNAMIDGFIVKQDIPRRVIWDAVKLSIMYTTIVDSGDDADKYIKRVEKYSISEKDFSTFPAELQAFFSEARTVEYGKPKITIEKKEK